MANPEHVEILKRGVEVWNKWRKEYPYIQPDLVDANFMGSDLRKIDLNSADLMGANLSNANLSEADLSEAFLLETNLSYALLDNSDLSSTRLRFTNLSNAHLMNTYLNSASLMFTNLAKSHLISADLSFSNLIVTNFTGATLTNCNIYGISVWDIELEGATQLDLIITREGQPTITVDNLEVAQFIYLLLNNSKLRNVINTITSKVVLILGRFTQKRKIVLDALKDELRSWNYLPVVFDFDPSIKRDLTETISTLAHMARFIIADLTDAKSIPQELKAIIPNLPSVPIQPLLHARSKEYTMFEHFKNYPWVLDTFRYTSTKQLLASLEDHLIAPAERRIKEVSKG